MDASEQIESRKLEQKFERVLLQGIRGGRPDAPHEMKHLFAPGVYWREIMMYAGTVLIGREHTTEHFNVVLTGKANVLIDGDPHLIDATKEPVVFTSKPGVRKVLEIIEDMRWATIHPNPDGIEDIWQLERMLSVKSPEEIEHEKAMKELDARREEICLSG